MPLRSIMFLFACLGWMVVSATAQTEVVIDLQRIKVNPIARADKPTFTIEGVVIRYPEFVRHDRQISRTTTPYFGFVRHDSVRLVDGRVIVGPQLNADSIVFRENGDITECVIHAQVTNCKLPLKWGSVSIVFPFHLVACYRVLGSEGVCNENKVNITVTY